MELSASLFEQTVCLIRGYGAEGKSNKRAVPRVGARFRVKLAVRQPRTPPELIEAWSRDISRRGIGLICGRGMQTTERFQIDLSRGPAERPLTIFCLVRHSSELAPGVHVVGAEFENAATWAPQRGRA